MQDEVNVRADEITVLSVVVACAHLRALDMGRSGSTPTLGKNRMRISVSLATSLIEIGLAIHGFAEEALDLYFDMQGVGVVEPDSLTFTGALSAGSHAGLVLVHEGFEILDSMTKTYTAGLVREGGI
ncbi:hypothetical protein MRB53_019286 [Persea americana]|uniref:Uncharacterized protein n=1 Tax=Persea americana TaxID=3435 RepID=A0ACC2KYV5_PERAE|nr:hypothetical protein MRB53_019286 [Persea americana]